MLELEVITPRRRLFKVICDTVTLPGVSGEFQITEGHAPLLSGLKTGILTFEKKQADTQDEFLVDVPNASEYSLMVSGGYAEVADNKISVLSEIAAMPSEIKEEAEQQLVKDLEKRIQAISDEESKEFKKLETDLERAAVKLMLVKR